MSCADLIGVPNWYAIHTHPKQEDRVNSNLNTWNVETFFPKIRGCRFNEFTGDPSYFIKPFFPRYLFARFILKDLLHKVRFTRGVHSIVCIGSNPVPVDNRVIEIIASQIDVSGFVEIDNNLEPGAKVLILAGPFKKFTGIFEREASDIERIRILLDCVSFQACVEVERNRVKLL